MSKAEQRAFEAYPPKYAKQERHSKRIQSKKVDTHQPMRTIYIQGYHQAEKDLELTWKDFEIIHKITYDEIRNVSNLNRAATVSVNYHPTYINYNSAPTNLSHLEINDGSVSSTPVTGWTNGSTGVSLSDYGVSVSGFIAYSLCFPPAPSHVGMRLLHVWHHPAGCSAVLWRLPAYPYRHLGLPAPSGGL